MRSPNRTPEARKDWARRHGRAEADATDRAVNPQPASQVTAAAPEHHGLWPDGEPREVRQAYDDGASASRDPDPEFGLTDGLTPQQTAELLARLEQGSKDAWRATHEVPWLSATYESRFQAASEVDGVFRDAMRNSLATGHRQIGEKSRDITHRLEAPNLGTPAWPPARRPASLSPGRT